MSRLILNEGGAPSTPATSKQAIYADSSDGKIKAVNAAGFKLSLTEDGLRGWNAIINGEFDYAQRQVPGTLTTYSNTSGRALSADRFGITNETTSVQYKQFDTTQTIESGLQSRFYGQFSKITTTGKIIVSQVIESGNCLHLRGRQVRVQLRMKASSAKTMRVALLQLTNAGTVDAMPVTFVSAFGANGTDPTFGTNLSKITPDTGTADNATIANSGVTCSVTTAWQRFGFAATLPTDFKNLVLVIFTDSQFVAADTFSCAEVGLYDGFEIREWVPRQQTQQYANCQRYYQKSFPITTAPVQNAGLTGAWRGNAAQAGAVSFVHDFIVFPVPMRIAPTTIIFFNPSAANAFLRQTVTPSDATATSATQVTDRGMEITATGLAAWVKGDGIAVHYTADAEI